MDQAYNWCVKNGYYADAGTLVMVKKAMENSQPLNRELEQQFAEVLLLFKTSLILGRA